MNDFTLGQHEQAINQLSSDVKEIKATVLRIELALAEKRGERRVALWLASAAGTAAAAAVSLLFKLAGAVMKHL
ncbi:MAG TPA: hypothetical protein VF159_03280 [Gemmatimonadaceae bacterium]